MARSLVAIRVKIFLDPNTGYALYPDFNRISSATRNGMNWSKYIDIHGSGWIYDRKIGHKEADVVSPHGMQWGVILVPEAFATEAETLFPTEVTIIPETQLQNFYETRVTHTEFEQEIDDNVINRLRIKNALGVALTPTELRALDPTDSEIRGIRKNMRKLWADRKINDDIEIDARVTSQKIGLHEEDELDKAWNSHFGTK